MREEPIGVYNRDDLPTDPMAVLERPGLEIDAASGDSVETDNSFECTFLVGNHPRSIPRRHPREFEIIARLWSSARDVIDTQQYNEFGEINVGRDGLQFLSGGPLDSVRTGANFSRPMGSVS